MPIGKSHEEVDKTLIFGQQKPLINQRLEMTPNDIAKARLSNQQLNHHDFGTAKELVGHMGAMQAQDFAMSQRAVGVRLPSTSAASIQTAINSGEIIRTHVLRPTWHLVSPDDIYWMLELSRPQINALAKSRHKELELSEVIFRKSNRLIEESLSNGEHLTREELVAVFEQAGIANEDNRAAYLFLRAELDGIICSGASKGTKPTYALLPERVPHKRMLTREEALSTLAKRYFISHGPATVYDFAWWSGLSITDARKALDLVKSQFIAETIDSKIYWFDASLPMGDQGTQIHLLPAFDEFIIGYTDRSASVPDAHFKKTVMINGIFRPVVAIDGVVTGVWKRTLKKDNVIMDITLFKPHSQAAKKAIDKKAEAFGHFLEKQVAVHYLE
ncbi:winged helix DNA-binding domain-containing protein [Parapedobacter tibetensis]|uniref:winged helix DNA-binding domain-containing protein n=1 Tax=Parapedobacter tibetensis TaxID=2972951 RepID=UPI00214DA136|nr:winged helix DNA-binding domain-containing protein [Parapedobacter tibetensis]